MPSFVKKIIKIIFIFSYFLCILHSNYSFANPNPTPPANPPPPATVSDGTNRGVEIRQTGLADVTSQRYSIQQDLSGFCQYTTVTQNGTNYKALDINSNIYNSDNILMGISHPKYCPLPGRDFLPDGYPDAIAGEFLLSGVVCVVQSIILDSMFRVYCTILLWFYQILFAMIVVYIMFYGLAIIFDLTEEPLKQAPSKIILITFILLLSSNAELGFKWIYGTFNSVLTTFSDILTRLQPLYTEGGERVYDNEGRLLDINGNIWKPLANGTPYVFVNPFTNSSGQPDQSVFNETITSPPTSMPIKNGTHNFEVIPTNEAYKYVPFRVPAQQWQGKLEQVNGSNNREYKVYPVFKQISDPVTQRDLGFSTCVGDFKYNYQLRRVELFPRCSEKNWPVVPEFAPYGFIVNKNISPVGEEGIFESIGQYNSNVLTPPKLEDMPNNVDTECTDPKRCRKPFQGIIGKIDALFDSVVGDDRAKGLTSMVIALSLWAGGGGTFLSLFLLTGILAMFVAFVQILWVYVTSLMGLTFLMMLAPIFISLKLFRITSQMFNAWLSMLVSFMWQPIIVLGVVYVLSSATSLDRLTGLARNELGTKQYTKTSGAKNSPTINYSAPGFLEPLYELPTDYDEIKNLSGQEASGLTNVEGNFISLAQRKLYRKLKSEYFATYYQFRLAGLNDEEARRAANDKGRVAELNNSQSAKDFANIYYNKTTISEGTAPNIKSRDIQGIDAILYYSLPATQLPAGFLVTKAELEEFIRIYREGVDSGIDDIVLDTPLGIEDRDAYIGEPRNPPNTDPNLLGEYPNCVKYCPEFHPPYNPAVADTTNPTSAQCVGFCLYSYADKEEMFSYISGAIIIWLLLNAMVGAFMSQVPAIAEKLSRIYGAESPKIYGSSLNNKQTGWAGGGRSEVTNLGGIFDMGIFSGTPGALARLGDTLQMKANRTRVIGNDGIPVEQPGRSWFEESPLSTLNKKEDNMVKAYDVIKLIQADAFNKNLLKFAKGANQSNGEVINYAEMEKEIKKEILDKESPNKVWTKDEIKEKYIKFLEKKKEQVEKEQKGKSSGIIQSPAYNNSPSVTEESLKQDAYTALDKDLERGGTRTAISSLTSEDSKPNFVSWEDIDPALTASVSSKKDNDWLAMTTEEPSKYQSELGVYDTMPISQREYDALQERLKQQATATNQQNLVQNTGSNPNFLQMASKLDPSKSESAKQDSKNEVNQKDNQQGEGFREAISQKTSEGQIGEKIKIEDITKNPNFLQMASKLDPSKLAQNKNYLELKKAISKGDVKSAALATANLAKNAKSLQKEDNTLKSSSDNFSTAYEKLTDVEGVSRMDIQANDYNIRKPSEIQTEEIINEPQPQIAQTPTLTQELGERINLENLLVSQENLVKSKILDNSEPTLANQTETFDATLENKELTEVLPEINQPITPLPVTPQPVVSQVNANNKNINILAQFGKKSEENTSEKPKEDFSEKVKDFAGNLGDVTRGDFSSIPIFNQFTNNSEVSPPTSEATTNQISEGSLPTEQNLNNNLASAKPAETQIPQPNQSYQNKNEKIASNQELFALTLARVKAKAGVTNSQISAAVAQKVAVYGAEIPEHEIEKIADLLAAEINSMEFLGVTDNKPNPIKANEGGGLMSAVINSGKKENKPNEKISLSPKTNKKDDKVS